MNWLPVLLCCTVTLALPLPDEIDSDDSRKVLGSSVVTSVSVITDLGNGSEAIFTDAVGKPVQKPNIGSDVGSPVEMATPDHYQYYSFDSAGNLIKRFMTKEDVSSIIATSQKKNVAKFSSHPTFYHGVPPAAGNLELETTQEGEEPTDVVDQSQHRVHSVVENVQNLLKSQMTQVDVHPEIPSHMTPDTSASWSMILPSYFGSQISEANKIDHPSEETEVITDKNTNNETSTVTPVQESQTEQELSGMPTLVTFFEVSDSRKPSSDVTTVVNNVTESDKQDDVDKNVQQSSESQMLGDAPIVPESTVPTSKESNKHQSETTTAETTTNKIPESSSSTEAEPTSEEHFETKYTQVPLISTPKDAVKLQTQKETHTSSNSSENYSKPSTESETYSETTTQSSDSYLLVTFSEDVQNSTKKNNSDSMQVSTTTTLSTSTSTSISTSVTASNISSVLDAQPHTPPSEKTDSNDKSTQTDGEVSSLSSEVNSDEAKPPSLIEHVEVPSQSTTATERVDSPSVSTESLEVSSAESIMMADSPFHESYEENVEEKLTTTSSEESNESPEASENLNEQSSSTEKEVQSATSYNAQDESKEENDKNDSSPDEFKNSIEKTTSSSEETKTPTSANEETTVTLNKEDTSAETESASTEAQAHKVETASTETQELSETDTTESIGSIDKTDDLTSSEKTSPTTTYGTDISSEGQASTNTKETVTSPDQTSAGSEVNPISLASETKIKENESEENEETLIHNIELKHNMNSPVSSDEVSSSSSTEDTSQPSVHTDSYTYEEISSHFSDITQSDDPKVNQKNSSDMVNVSVLSEENHSSFNQVDMSTSSSKEKVASNNKITDLSEKKKTSQNNDLGSDGTKEPSQSENKFPLLISNGDKTKNPEPPVSASPFTTTDTSSSTPEVTVKSETTEVQEDAITTKTKEEGVSVNVNSNESFTKESAEDTSTSKQDESQSTEKVDNKSSESKEEFSTWYGFLGDSSTENMNENSATEIVVTSVSTSKSTSSKVSSFSKDTDTDEGSGSVDQTTLPDNEQDKTEDKTVSPTQSPATTIDITEGHNNVLTTVLPHHIDIEPVTSAPSSMNSAEIPISTEIEGSANATTTSEGDLSGKDTKPPHKNICKSKHSGENGECEDIYSGSGSGSGDGSDVTQSTEDQFEGSGETTTDAFVNDGLMTRPYPIGGKNTYKASDALPVTASEEDINDILKYAIGPKDIGITKSPTDESNDSNSLLSSEKNSSKSQSSENESAVTNDAILESEKQTSTEENKNNEKVMDLFQYINSDVDIGITNAFNSSETDATESYTEDTTVMPDDIMLSDDHFNDNADDDEDESDDSTLFGHEQFLKEWNGMAIAKVEKQEKEQEAHQIKAQNVDTLKKGPVNTHTTSTGSLPVSVVKDSKLNYSSKPGIMDDTQWSKLETLSPSMNTTDSLQQKTTVKPAQDFPLQDEPEIGHRPHFPSPTPVELHPAPQESLGLEASTMYLVEDVQQFAELCNELAFKLWVTMTEKSVTAQRSLVMSPFAVTSLLAMIFLGAKGSTSGQMNDMLKLDDMMTFNPHQVFKNVTDSVVATRNPGVRTAAFVRELYSDQSKGELLDFYKQRVSQFYDGHVEEANFTNIGDIIRRRTNLLIKRQTGGRVPEFLRGSSLEVQPPLAALSANIFQTDCRGASTDGRDGEMYFTILPATRQRRLVPIPAVVYRTGFLAGYEPSLDATVVSLGMQDSAISTLFVLPGQQGQTAPGDGLSRLEARLIATAYTNRAWSRLLRSLLQRPRLEIQVPRFSHRSLLNITSSLHRMGLSDLFNAATADLKGLGGFSTTLHVSDVAQVNTFTTCGEEIIGSRHHVEIYPSEMQRSRRGSMESIPLISRPRQARLDHGLEPSGFEEAVSQEGIIQMPLALRPRQARLPDGEEVVPRLKFDRPFLYFVRHNPTGFILHMGRFNPRLLH